MDTILLGNTKPRLPSWKLMTAFEAPARLDGERVFLLSHPAWTGDEGRRALPRMDHRAGELRSPMARLLRVALNNARAALVAESLNHGTVPSFDRPGHSR